MLVARCRINFCNPQKWHILSIFCLKTAQNRGVFSARCPFKSNKRSHSGDNGDEDPPVPIPNTEVKLVYAESTWHIAPGRIGSCRISIKNPFFDFSYKKLRIIRGFWSKIRAFYKICPRFVHGFFGIYRGLILFQRYDCIQYLQSFGIHCFGLVRVSLERRRYVFVPEPCRYDF